MSLRATGWLAVAALVLAGLVVWLETGGEGGPSGGPGLLFPALDPERVESIAWQTGGQRVRAARLDGGWQIVEPLTVPADAASLDLIANALGAVRSAGTVDDPVDASVYGLADEATRIVFVHGGVEGGFALGAETPLGGAVYGTLAGREGEVHLVPVQQAAMFDRALDDLRDRRVLDFSASEATRVRLASKERAESGSGGFQATLERDAEGWRMLAPAELPVDVAAVDRLLSDLALLRAERFVDVAGPREDEQLARPEFVVEIDAGGGSQRFLLAASGGPESLRLVRGREERVFLVRDALVAHMPTGLFDLRAKALARFDAASVRAVEVETAAGENFRGVPGESLAQALGSLDATGVVAEALGTQERSALGLAPARLRVRILGPEGALLADLSFGRLHPSRGLVAAVAGSDAVFYVSGAVEAELPFDVSQLEAEVTPPE